MIPTEEARRDPTGTVFLAGFAVYPVYCFLLFMGCLLAFGSDRITTFKLWAGVKDSLYFLLLAAYSVSELNELSTLPPGIDGGMVARRAAIFAYLLSPLLWVKSFAASFAAMALYALVFFVAAFAMKILQTIAQEPTDGLGGKINRFFDRFRHIQWDQNAPENRDSLSGYNLIMAAYMIPILFMCFLGTPFGLAQLIGPAATDTMWKELPQSYAELSLLSAILLGWLPPGQSPLSDIDPTIWRRATRLLGWTGVALFVASEYFSRV